uniref:E3 ubiquitin ligase complex SCF subunit n=1 Tax=Moniliophthora roreri TaxID=221103 RepID=A0A0W0F814_MONRR
MVLFVTSDNQEFTVDQAVIERSVLIKNILKDVGESDQPIPLHNVTSSFLQKALEYYEHPRGKPLPASSPSPFNWLVSALRWRTTADSGQSQDDTRKRTTHFSEWDQKFLAVDQVMLFEHILATNYLGIVGLMGVLSTHSQIFYTKKM